MESAQGLLFTSSHITSEETCSITSDFAELSAWNVSYPLFLLQHLTQYPGTQVVLNKCLLNKQMSDWIISSYVMYPNYPQPIFPKPYLQSLRTEYWITFRTPWSIIWILLFLGPRFQSRVIIIRLQGRVNCNEKEKQGKLIFHPEGWRRNDAYTSAPATPPPVDPLLNPHSNAWIPEYATYFSCLSTFIPLLQMSFSKHHLILIHSLNIHLVSHLMNYFTDLAKLSSRFTS